MASRTLTLVIDDEVDAAYISLTDIGPGEVVANVVVDDRRLRGEVVLDLNATGDLVGIELIGYRAMHGEA